MGKTYEKDGSLYEEGLFGDTKIGEIEHGLTGDYVVDSRFGGGVYDVDKNFKGETNITTHRDYLSNEESGATIRSNPFSSHGQDSENWSRPIWGESKSSPANSKQNDGFPAGDAAESSYNPSADRSEYFYEIINRISFFAVIIGTMYILSRAYEIYQSYGWHGSIVDCIRWWMANYKWLLGI